MEAYTLGLIFGIIVGIGVFLIAWFFRRKNHPELDKYDERQTVGRGKAFRAGFYTLLTANAAVSVWDYLDGLPGEPFLWHFSALMLGVTVFALTAIHYDAYVGMYDTPHRWMKIGICLFVAMALSGYSNLRSGRPEGRVMAFLNLSIAVIWVIIVAALMLHRHSTQQEDEE